MEAAVSGADLHLRLKVGPATAIVETATQGCEALEETSFDRLINIRSYTDAELKSLARQLEEEERELSKRRRLLHAEIDIVRAEMVRRLRDRHGAGEALVQDGDIARLTEILSGKGTRLASSENEPGAPQAGS